MNNSRFNSRINSRVNGNSLSISSIVVELIVGSMVGLTVVVGSRIVRLKDNVTNRPITYSVVQIVSNLLIEFMSDFWTP